MISPRLEALAWFKLANSRGIGSKKLWVLADYLSREHKDAQWVMERIQSGGDLPPQLASKLSLSDQIGNQESLYEEFESLEQKRITVLHPLNSEFPEKLSRFKGEHSLPGLLYVSGSLSLLRQRSVSIVGSRNADERCLELTRKLARNLANEGINVISGYARGIDFAAHLESLKCGGTTTIVLSEGIAKFAHKVEIRSLVTPSNTAVVSQFSPGARWAAHNAMARNKLVVALSDAIVIVTSGPERDESNRMSGTFDAGISAQQMHIPTFVVSPSWFTEAPIGNRDLIMRGCTAWDPNSGVQPITAALEQRPLRLF